MWCLLPRLSIDASSRPFPKYKTIDFGEISAFDCEPCGLRKTAIIGTLGDPKISIVDIQKMMEAGMNGTRFLTSHFTTGDRIKLLGKIDRAAKILASKHGLQAWPCATCIELKTSLVSTGILEKDITSVTLKEKSEVILTYDTSEFDKCNANRIFVDNPYIVTDATVGMDLSIKQDNIILKVTEILADTVKCVVVKEGVLGSLEPLCMTGATRTRPYITKKDLELTKFAIEYQVDIMIINYSRHPETVRQIKKYIGHHLRKPFIISGICTYEGLCNIDDIIKETDGVLLSRELLAYELDRSLFYRMGQIQKMIIGKCRQAGKPLFISGQVFGQTLESGRLVNQDVSDVTNSILEGASGFIIDNWDDADVLKLAIKELSLVCAEIEPFTDSKVDFERNLFGLPLPANAAIATAVSSVLLAKQSLSKVIIIPTVSGSTIYHLNHMQPSSVIIAITTNMKTFRLLQIFRSVLPIFYTGETHHIWLKIVKARIGCALDHAVDKGLLNYGDFYITLEKGTEESSYCDTVKACKVTSKKSLNVICPGGDNDKN